MKKIGIGFVGAGWMGSTQLRQLAIRDDVEILALLEPHAQRGTELLAELGLPSSLLVQDYQQILDNQRVQAVWLVSPNSHHGPQSIAAMEAGKHVFCEKPCATSFEDYQRQLQLQRAHPELMTYVNYILYFDSQERRLRQMVADNLFGTITQIQVNYRHAVNTSGDKTWKLRQAVMGDAIGMGINHALSVMIHAMQSQARPIRVYATSQPAKARPFEVDPIWTIVIGFDNGASGVCMGNIDNSNGYDAYHGLFGTDGAFVFDSQLDRPQKVRYWSRQHADGKWIFPLDARRCAQQGAERLTWPADTTTPDSGNVIDGQIGACIEHFLSCVHRGTPSPLSFVNSASIAEVGWAALISARTGQPVNLPLDPLAASKYLNDK